MSENSSEYSEVWRTGKDGGRLEKQSGPQDPIQGEFKQMIAEEKVKNNPRLNEIVQAFGPKVEPLKAEPLVPKVKKSALDRLTERLIGRVRKALNIEPQVKSGPTEAPPLVKNK